MTWLTFILISLTVVAVANLVARSIMKNQRVDPLIITILFQVLGSLITFIFVFFKGFVLPPLDKILLNLILTGTLYGLASLFSFKMMYYLEASEATILTSLKVPLTIVSAIFLLKENFSLARALGTLLILVAVVIITNVRKASFNKGTVYALLTALCVGLAITNDTFILKHYETYSYNFLAFFLPALFLILIKPSSLIKIYKIPIKLFLKLT